MRIITTQIRKLVQVLYLRDKSRRVELLVLAILSMLAIESCTGTSKPIISTTTSAQNSSVSSPIPHNPEPTPSAETHITQEINSPEMVQVSLVTINDFSIVKISDNLYRISILLPTFSYQVNKQDGYDLIEIADGYPNQTPGAPVLPLFEVIRLLLPHNGEIKTSNLLQGHIEAINDLNVPTVEVKPFSEGGITFVDLPAKDQLMPSDTELLSHQQLSQNEWLFLFSPFQYNPQTDEMRLWQEVEVQIDYAISTTLALGSIETDSNIIEPGDIILLQIPLWNLGTNHQAINISLSLLNPNGEIVNTSISSLLEVRSASENRLEVVWEPELMPGIWNCILRITDKDGQLLGLAGFDIQVR